MYICNVQEEHTTKLYLQLENKIHKSSIFSLKTSCMQSKNVFVLFCTCLQMMIYVSENCSKYSKINQGLNISLCYHLYRELKSVYLSYIHMHKKLWINIKDIMKRNFIEWVKIEQTTNFVCRLVTNLFKSIWSK